MGHQGAGPDERMAAGICQQRHPSHARLVPVHRYPTGKGIAPSHCIPLLPCALPLPMMTMFVSSRLRIAPPTHLGKVHRCGGEIAERSGGQCGPFFSHLRLPSHHHPRHVLLLYRTGHFQPRRCSGTRYRGRCVDGATIPYLPAHALPTPCPRSQARVSVSWRQRHWPPTVPRCVSRLLHWWCGRAHSLTAVLAGRQTSLGGGRRCWSRQSKRMALVSVAPSLRSRPT